TDHRERGTALTDISTHGSDASVRLVGSGTLPFSVLGYLQLREFANRFASANEARDAVNPTLNQYTVPSTGMGARAEIRPALGDVQLRAGADWRETEGQTQELFQFTAGSPNRERRAGGRTRTIGGFVEGTLESGPVTFTAAGRVDRWWIADGRLRER